MWVLARVTGCPACYTGGASGVTPVPEAPGDHLHWCSGPEPESCTATSATAIRSPPSAMDLVKSRVPRGPAAETILRISKKRFATEEPGLAAAGGQLDENICTRITRHRRPKPYGHVVSSARGTVASWCTSLHPTAPSPQRRSRPRVNDRPYPKTRPSGQHPRRRFLRLAAGAAALPAVSHIARAQSYPTRPVRIIVGFAAGGATDLYARLIGQRLSERLGRSFIIDNRPGAGSNIGTRILRRRSKSLPSMCGREA